MSYRVLIGINVALDKGEKWREKNGNVIVDESGGAEVRFEPGEVVAQFPKRTDIKSLFQIGAIELLEEELGDG